MKRYLIAGLLVWVPLGITIWVITSLVSTLDQTLLLVPAPLRPEALVGFHIPGLGVVLSFVICGSPASSPPTSSARVSSGCGRVCWAAFRREVDLLVGEAGERHRAFRSRDGVPQGAARRVSAPRLLDHRFPDRRAGRSGRRSSSRRSRQRLRADNPNPTGGYFVMVPKSAVRELDMSVDDALKYIISMGVVSPRRRLVPPPKAATPLPVAAHPRN
jgi:hypothetical protein